MMDLTMLPMLLRAFYLFIERVVKENVVYMSFNAM